MHSATGINDEDVIIPNEAILSQNYPNPFNASTTIEYNLPHKSEVRIEIYDIMGRKVETLIEDNQEAGINRLKWDASDYPSGIYFYKLSYGDKNISRKMVLLK
jgi:flagellar hook assembly protein FlgD